jgi:hypothetical protein
MATRINTGLGFLWIETCCNCGTVFAMSEHVHATALNRREKFQFYCPNGHEQHYVSGESEADKLRRERDRLRQEAARLNDRIREESERADLEKRRASAAKGQVTKMKRRAAAGICPCCNRSFTNLQRHMSSQHPGFVTEPDAADHIH